jgi:hypothetical protein
MTGGLTIFMNRGLPALERRRMKSAARLELVN